MTREEAIEILQGAIKKPNTKDGYLGQAIDMAIKALEQEPTTKNDLGVDCVNRSTVLTLINDVKNANGFSEYSQYEYLFDQVDTMPSVTPIRPKGHWIKTSKAVMGEGYMWYCDKCKHQVYQDSSRDYPSEKFCPSCGSDNREVEE